jgi:glycosyltransferase involved in cell wall biosynthesis
MDEVFVEVIFPCLNEREALPAVLGGLPAGFRAIVVDNGSTDGSARVAEELGARVVHEPRLGYGAAVHTGLLAAIAPVVAFCDADGSFDSAQLAEVVAPVLSGRADLVLGRRRAVSAWAWPPHARLANAVLSAWLRRITGVRVHDLGPMRAADRERLLMLGLEDRRSGYPLELFLRAADNGLRIEHVDVEYRPRIGRSKVTGTVRGTLTAVRDMRGLLRARRAGTAAFALRGSDAYEDVR